METLVSLLPAYNPSSTLLVGGGLPCHGAKIECKPIDDVLKMIKRQAWVEGLYVEKTELSKVIRYKNADGSYRNDFDENQFLLWVNNIENNTALCEMENKNLGMGVFIPPGKILPRGTFIPSSGIIKFEPTIEELETKNNCSALQDLNTPEKKIIGFIDPEIMGGILNFINHAPDKDEITNFVFKKSYIEENVATANLKSVIKFYDGYAVMGLEAFDDIQGGEHGTQLLWSYARCCEYIESVASLTSTKAILLFDNRNKHHGETIDLNQYTLRMITIYVDSGELLLHQVASLTRWELMENSPESYLTISTADPYSITQSDPIQSLIPHRFLQTQLKQNPLANRIILRAPMLMELKKVIDKQDKS